MRANEIALARKTTSMSAWGRFLRRRHYIVNRSLQLQLVAMSVGQMFFFGTVLSTGLFLPLAIQLLAGPIDSPGTARAASYFLNLHSTFWWAAVLAFVVVFLHAVYTSHRLAGPLYRFRLSLETLNAGKVPRPVVLRTGDFLQPEAKVVNALLEQSRAAAQESLALDAELDRLLARLSALRTKVNDAELQGSIDEVLALRPRLKVHLTRLSPEA